VLEGAVGLEIVHDPVSGCLVPLSPVGSLVIERLSKGKMQCGWAPLPLRTPTSSHLPLHGSFRPSSVFYAG
jgi:hypothetical protein